MNLGAWNSSLLCSLCNPPSSSAASSPVATAATAIAWHTAAARKTLCTTRKHSQLSFAAGICLDAQMRIRLIRWLESPVPTGRQRDLGKSGGMIGAGRGVHARVDDKNDAP